MRVGLFLLSVFILCIGVLFKLQAYPYGSMILLIGFGTLSAALLKWSYDIRHWGLSLIPVGYVIYLFGALFKLNAWSSSSILLLIGSFMILAFNPTILLARGIHWLKQYKRFGTYLLTIAFLLVLISILSVITTLLKTEQASIFIVLPVYFIIITFITLALIKSKEIVQIRPERETLKVILIMKLTFTIWLPVGWYINEVNYHRAMEILNEYRLEESLNPEQTNSHDKIPSLI